MQQIQYGLSVDSTGAVKGLDNATTATEDLNNELKKTAKTGTQAATAVAKVGDDTELAIKKAEVKIKSIDGSIKLLGGAVETVVGSLGLLGVPEELQEEFQQAAASAIAFADGIKRLFEGYKDITEARKLYQSIQTAGAAVQSAETAAVVANTAAQTANTTAVAASTAARVSQIPVLKSTNVLSKVLNVAISALNKTMGAGAIAGQAAGKAIGGFAASISNASKAVGAALGTGPLGALLVLLTGLAAVYATVNRKTAEWRKNLQANVEIENELAGITKKAALDEERLLGYLTDKVEQRGLEKQAIEELKKAYPGFEAFLTRENQLTEQGIAFLKTRIALRKAEAGLATVTEKLVEEEVALAEIQAKNRAEYGFTTQAANMNAKAREESARKTDILRQKETEFTDAVNEALVELEKYNKVLAKQVSTTKFATDVLTPYEERLRVLRLELALLYDELEKSIFRSEGTILDVRYLGTLDASLDKLQGSLGGVAERFKEIADAQDELEDPIKFFNFPQDVLDRLSGKVPQDELNQALAQRKAQYDEEYKLLEGNLFRQKQLEEEYEKDIAKLKRQYALQTSQQLLGITSQFLGVIAEVNQASLDLQLQQAGNNQAAIDQINKEAFESQKKLRIAQTLITTAESVLNAFAVTSNIPPPFGQIIGGILAASYTALGAKTIALIKGTQYGGGSSTAGGFNNIPSGGGGFSLPGGQGTPLPTGGGNILPGLPGGGRLGNAPTVGTIGEAPVPIQAYVLASDVSNGQQAQAAINNRRRLGAG